MMKFQLSVFLVLFPVSVLAQNPGEIGPVAEPKHKLDAPKLKLGDTQRKQFKPRFLKVSDVFLIAKKALTSISQNNVVDQDRGDGKAPEGKSPYQTASIGKTLLIADHITNTLIVSGHPEQIQVIQDLITAIDLRIDLKKKEPETN